MTDIRTLVEEETGAKHIRLASVADFPRMSEAAKAFYDSSKFLKRFDIDKFIESWTRIYSINLGAIWILEINGKIQGALGALCVPDGYSDGVIAEERFWFIRPEFRGSGIRLYRMFKRWAKERGATEIQMCHLCDSMPEKLERFYTAEGYELIEKRYGMSL